MKTGAAMIVTQKITKKARMLMAPCLFLILSTASIPALAQQDVKARLDRLDNDMQTLSRAVFKGEKPPAGMFSGASAQQQANVEVRLGDLEQQIRTLTGTVEQQNYEMKTFQDRVEKTLAELQARTGGVSAIPSSSGISPGISSGSVGGPTAAPLTGPDLNVPAEATATVGTIGALTQTVDNNDPAAVYEQAFSNLRDKKYPEAETGFTDFLARFSDNSLASNARYWLGETYYVRGQYDRAARTFAEGYQKDPKGTKGPDNLLKLALSLSGLGKKDDACLTLSQIKKEYGDSAGPVKARADREGETMGCK